MPSRWELRRRRERVTEKCEHAWNRMLGRKPEPGREAMKRVRRTLKRDMPRYFERLPVPRDFEDIQSLTLRDWLYLLPLLIIVALIIQRSPWLLLGIVVMLFIATAD